MSDVLGLAGAVKQDLMEAFVARLDGGHVRIYSGTRPATADTAVTSQTLLLTLNLPDPAGTVASGGFTGDAIDSAICAADGNATWCRILDSALATLADGDVGLTGSGALVTLDNLALVAGGEITASGFTLAWG